MSETTTSADSAAAAVIHRVKQVNKRLNVRIPVRISTIDPERDPATGKLFFFTADEFSANVSRGGAFVATPELIDPGRRVLVEIDIPNGSSLQAVGRVVWKRLAKPDAETPAGQRAGIGIQFTSGRPDLFNELDRYINLAVRRRNSAKALNRTNQLGT